MSPGEAVAGGAYVVVGGDHDRKAAAQARRLTPQPLGAAEVAATTVRSEGDSAPTKAVDDAANLNAVTFLARLAADGHLGGITRWR